MTPTPRPARIATAQRDYPPVTPASVAAAREAQQRERALVEAQTGVRILDDGRVVKGSPS